MWQPAGSQSTKGSAVPGSQRRRPVAAVRGLGTRGGLWLCACTDAAPRWGAVVCASALRDSSRPDNGYGSTGQFLVATADGVTGRGGERLRGETRNGGGAAQSRACEEKRQPRR
ncbi:hypothetical protein E2562_008788 [Oryza meyeriana var. granulata]|uniref:Uncharacterized protein n=1 Tax=Oryza meyeriana var. granulata TaxID=110450 RepID=A0A6G1D017_9ORYZ|nr:hypothetical protein E2562_008788 [Oryza meyeriana var. granulata]